MPVSEAQYVMVISSRTGWAEEYIRWWLPLGRGWAYYHAARLLDGVAMRFPMPSTEDDVWWEDVEQRLRQIKKKRRADLTFVDQ